MKKIILLLLILGSALPAISEGLTSAGGSSQEAGLGRGCSAPLGLCDG